MLTYVLTSSSTVTCRRWYAARGDRVWTSSLTCRRPCGWRVLFNQYLDGEMLEVAGLCCGCRACIYTC